MSKGNVQQQGHKKATLNSSQAEHLFDVDSRKQNDLSLQLHLDRDATI